MDIYYLVCTLVDDVAGVFVFKFLLENKFLRNFLRNVYIGIRLLLLPLLLLLLLSLALPLCVNYMFVVFA